MLKESEIRRFIDEDALSDRKRLAKVGQRYYEGDHDILQYRMFYYNKDGVLVEDKARSNSRICHPFFTELVDQMAAYILSFEENPIRAKEVVSELQDHLDVYFDDEFWAEVQELITGAYSKGFEYFHAYKNTDDRLAFECADSLGVVEIRAKDTDDDCEHIIYWYVDRVGKDRKLIKRIQVYDKDQTWFYKQVDNGRIILDKDEEINPKPNYMWTDSKSGEQFGDSLGFIPFWRLDYCKKQFGGLKPIKGLIDDYDLMQCGLSNNLQDFDKPIHLVKGFQGDDLDELQQNIRTKKILGVDADGGLDILTVDVPYQARKTKADEDEKNIYRFGMGLNTQGLKDTTATTNIAIKTAYTLLDLKCNKFTLRLKRFLKGIIRVVIDEINAMHDTDYQYTDVDIVFEPSIPTNEQEAVQNAKTEAETEQIRINSILNVATIIGDEETLKGICGILDLDFDELKGLMESQKENQNLANAQAMLEDVVTNDEQPAEVGSAALSE